jgi:hypothetical protein
MNWYTKPVADRFPAVQKRCQELMTEKEWQDFVCDAPAGGLLEAMENWLEENDNE